MTQPNTWQTKEAAKFVRLRALIDKFQREEKPPTYAYYETLEVRSDAGNLLEISTNGGVHIGTSTPFTGRFWNLLVNPLRYLFRGEVRW